VAVDVIAFVLPLKPSVVSDQLVVLQIDIPSAVVMTDGE
jgi:hypothetical protein